MRSFTVLFEKELRESLRTKRFLVLACVFLSFAIMSPMMARFMGELLELLLPAGDAEAFMVLFPDPTWIDSYVQFYGNMSQIGAIVIAIMFMGLVIREKKSGSIDLLFCKGVTPTPFILSKFCVAVCITLVSLLLAILVNFGYTVLLFEEGGQLGYVLLGVGAYGVFVMMLVAMAVLASTVAKSTAASAVWCILGFMLILLISALPTIGRFLPGALASNNAAITQGYFDSDLWLQMGVTLALAAGFLLLAIWRLKKQEL